MSISTNMESQISSNISTYGSVIWVQKQTGSYNTTYNDTEWTDSTSSSTTALILPFSHRTIGGEEYRQIPVGILQETEYLGFFWATETLEEVTGASPVRYLIEFNSIDYEIIKIFPIEFQDNVIVKKCFLRKLTT